MSSRRHRRMLPSVSGPGFSAPPIGPPPDEGPQPRISVMIPTYNCAEYLRICLRSVLEQDPGEAVMQIEVIDDCSTLDDPEAVVRELGADRVVFTRQPSNVGAVENFNSCIRRARGELVHILHGDDHVMPGFYAEIERLALSAPTAAIYATPVYFIDEAGAQQGTSVPLGAYLHGASRDLAAFDTGCPLQFAGTVVRRAAYERHGGFRPALIHAADVEMWMRLVVAGGMAAGAETLGAYRRFAASDTSRLVRTGENLLDYDRSLAVAMANNYPFDEETRMRGIRRRALVQATLLARAGDAEGAAASLSFWLERATPRERLRRRVVGVVRWLQRARSGVK